jgi:hypothetical protein
MFCWPASTQYDDKHRNCNTYSTVSLCCHPFTPKNRKTPERRKGCFAISAKGLNRPNAGADDILTQLGLLQAISTVYGFQQNYTLVFKCFALGHTIV